MAARCKTCSERPGQREWHTTSHSDSRIHFPGSRQYNSVGEIENAGDLEADPADVVKVVGTKEAIAQASEQLRISSERAPRTQTQEASRTVTIPNKYYHALAEQPNLIRHVRNAGGHLTFPQPGPPKPTVTSNADQAKAARIDLDADGQDAEAMEGQWDVIENYTNGPEGQLDWVVRGKDEDLGRIVGVLEDALERVKQATHGEWPSCQS